MVAGIFLLSVRFGWERADQQLSFSRFVLQLVALLSHSCSESLNEDAEADADSCSVLIIFSSLKKIVQTCNRSRAE